MSLENGIKKYVHCSWSVHVLFPVDWNGKEYIQCDKCPYFSASRSWCNLVNKPVEFPHKYVGSCCPLEREEGPFEISESKG